MIFPSFFGRIIISRRRIECKLCHFTLLSRAFEIDHGLIPEASLSTMLNEVQIGASTFLHLVLEKIATAIKRIESDGLSF